MRKLIIILVVSFILACTTKEKEHPSQVVNKDTINHVVLENAYIMDNGTTVETYVDTVTGERYEILY